MPSTTLNVNDIRCEALFASMLQPSDVPTADMVAEAIRCAVRQFGTRGCAGRMAQEFGDHPDAAAERMRWVHRLTAQAVIRPQAATKPHGRYPERSMEPAGGRRWNCIAG